MKTPKKPSTTLTINEVVTPRPTKRELIEALVILRFQKKRAEFEEIKAWKDQAEAKAKAAVVAHVVSNTKTIDFKVQLGYAGGNILRGVEVEASLDSLPRELEEKILAFHIIRVPFPPQMDAIRKEVRDAMMGATPPELRVQTLLADPGARAALQETLAAILPEKTEALKV